ncbi:MAG TPA: TRAP transporter substrate-binding protein [Cyclobacteriaceae bacterium]|nr:TRAP transporter substrate-binding protein [Cyclobacteriaceae bacterium]
MTRGISIFLISLITTSCGNLGKTKILKLGHGLDTSHPVHLAMLFMAESLEKKSAGKMKLEIYPAGQLGQERECLELLQIGSLAMTKVSAQIMENFAPDFQVFGLPYIFRDREHAFRVFDGPVGERLLNEGRKFWLLGLTFYDAGSRSFYTKDKPIFKPDDLRSLKIRVMPSTTAMNTVRAFGGSPTPIPWGELYTALQQGVVDGAENNSPSFYFSHHYEVCKFYSLNEHTIIPDVLLISTHVWDRLSESEKKWVSEAAEESAVYERKLWHDSEIKCLEEVRKAGVEIIYPDKAPFADKTQKVYDDYRENQSISELIRLIRETR